MTFTHEPLPSGSPWDAEYAQATIDGTATPSVNPMSIDDDRSGPVKNINSEVASVEWEKGELQPPLYRDKWFAVAFLLQLLAVAIVALAVGAPELQKRDLFNVVDGGVIAIVLLLLIGIFALATAFSALS